MFVCRRGVVLRSKLCVLARACALGATLLAGGCASDQEYREYANAHERQAYYVTGPHGAQGGPARQRSVEVELEDDGLPSQAAPPLDRRREPDDPREPFSPNYGSVGGTVGQRAEVRGVPMAAIDQRIAAN
jgi:hypothetical protein